MATRLLVIADSRMLSALASGLREGGKFEVQTAPLSDPAGAQAAAEKADAVALFYGAAGVPLPAALQALAPRVRGRGGRIVAVLQRDQAAQRDDCFRAGASDLLFMPMPKDQFVARLQGSLDLAWPGGGGAPAPVSVATRSASSKIDHAAVSPSGIESPAQLPLKPGDTVRLSWGAFQSWGLVVRGGPSAQIRFAGLAPDEEAKIRDWLKAGAPLQRPAAPSAPSPAAAAPSPAAAAPSPAAAAPSPAAAAAAAPEPEAAAPAAPIVPPPPATPTPPAGTRAAPAAGPPPGFAYRKPVRPQTRGPARVAPPVISGAGAAAMPAPAASAPPAATNGHAGPPVTSPALAGLFEEGAAPAPSPEAAVEAAPALPGPPWPVPQPLAACASAAMQLLKDKTVPADTPQSVVASARKITAVLSSGERAALEKAGADSALAGALAARIALDAATADGTRLYSSIPAATVDAAAVAALTRQADEAAARLQKDANAAVGKGEVESLQLVTAASAALSRDLLGFRETADRLRGLGAAPRLGSGALDPDMVLPGQAPRPAAPKGAVHAPPRAELRDFSSLDRRPGPWKSLLAVLMLLAFVAIAANAFYFSLPRHQEIDVTTIGHGLERVDVSGASALVAVSPDWVAHAETELPKLVSLLRERGVKKAIVMLPNGSVAGTLDVTTGKSVGLLKPKAPPPEPPK